MSGTATITKLIAPAITLPITTFAQKSNRLTLSLVETRKARHTPNRMHGKSLRRILSIGLTTLALTMFQFSMADPPPRPTFGNHNLDGIYAFRADGVIEADGLPTRGMWEIGRFVADGQGNMTQGVEYSSMLSAHDEDVIDIPYSFEGSYEIGPDGLGKGVVSVFIPAVGITIDKTIWFVVFDLDNRGIAHGFAHGHADAELGPEVHGNARTHVGRRMAPRPH